MWMDCLRKSYGMKEQAVEEKENAIKEERKKGRRETQTEKIILKNENCGTKTQGENEANESKEKHKPRNRRRKKEKVARSYGDIYTSYLRCL